MKAQLSKKKLHALILNLKKKEWLTTKNKSIDHMIIIDYVLSYFDFLFVH